MKQVSFYTILAAKKSDIDAIKTIVQHFKRYIILRCLTHCTGADGHDLIIVDVDLWNQAISALLSAIFTFHFRNPPDNFSWQKSPRPD